MEPGASHLLWLSIGQESKIWEEDMVLQPEEKLYTKLGLYMVPSLLSKEGQGPYCMVVKNHSKSRVTLNKGTVIDKLYSKGSIPKEVELIKDVNEMISVVHDKYLVQANAEGEEVLAPSLIVGPIFVPTYDKLEEAGIKVSKPKRSVAQDTQRVCSVYSLSVGVKEGVKL